MSTEIYMLKGTEQRVITRECMLNSEKLLAVTLITVNSAVFSLTGVTIVFLQNAKLITSLKHESIYQEECSNTDCKIY